MKKLIALIAAMVMVAGYGYAADWDFYGSVRVNTEFVDVDKPGSTADTEDTNLFLQGNSRIGANVKVNDSLSGRFEFGIGEGDTQDKTATDKGGNTVKNRILWGEWNFGAGSLGIGQHYAPLNEFYSNQIYDADTDLLYYGGLYSAREPQIRLTFGGFEIALVDEGVEGDGDTAVETNLPGIEAKYSFSVNNFSGMVGAGYNTFEMLDSGKTYDVDSYILTAGGSFNFGMIYLNGNAYFGENVNHIIVVDYTDGTEPTASISSGQLLDVENFGFIIVAGAKINDMFALEAGYGYAEADKDQAVSEDEVTSYYLQATVTLAPGVFFVPEIGVLDYEESDQDEITYGAIKWQINF